MKKGFTILELLVASMLLGMLVTILTMVFNQSSIAWRTGTATVSDLDAVRNNMAGMREEADNAFLIKNDVYMITSLWKEDGTLRERACEQRSLQHITAKPTSANPVWTGSEPVKGSKNSKPKKNYIVNVKSAGPDGQIDTYDDIWSYPDDFE